MLGGGHGKVVGAGEILLGAHVDVIVLGVVQDAFQTLVGRNSDRTRRESGILIRVIRRIHFQELEQDALQTEFLKTELYGWVGL